MNQFIEKQLYIVLAPISIGLDSLDIEQEIPYLTEGDIERPTTQRVINRTMRHTTKQHSQSMDSMPRSQMSANPFTEHYGTVSIKPGVKVWGKCMPNGSVYLLNSSRGTDFFCSVGPEEVSEKLLGVATV